MTELEYLLVCAAEEGVEIAHMATKCLRFGIGNTEPGKDASNETRFWQEVDDLHGVLELLITLRGQGGNTRENIDAKKAKMARMMRLSEEYGTLQRIGKIAG